MAPRLAQRDLGLHRRRWPSEQVPLYLQATPFHQHLELQLGFYAFSNHVDAKFSAEGNQRMDEARSLIGEGHIADQRSVELQAVYRQMRAIRQARVVGPGAGGRNPP